MARFEWKPIARGDAIPEGAILGGRTSTDGEVFVGKNRSGEVGKINLSDGKMHNLWCHKGKDSAEGEILIVSKGCPIQWVKVSKGDALPPDSLHAGDFDGDGAIYPCRRSGAVGKLNLNGDKVNNLWFHGEWFAKSDGEILVVGPPGAGKDWADQYKDASGGEAKGWGAWVKDHKGALAIAGGIAAAAGIGVGVAAAAGAFDGHKPSETPAEGYSGGDNPPAAEEHHVKHHEDPKNYDENLICDGIKAGERVAWLQNEEGMDHAAAVKTVMKEFPDVFKHWWKPHADCGGVQAQERAKWLVKEKGMSMDDARKQVRSEFPDVFGAGSKGHHVDGKFPHTLSIEETPEGPKLKIAVTPRDPDQVTLVAFHYQINQGQSMNFDVKHSEGETYVHQTPGGGGYPHCPRGSEVSYWLAAVVNGLIQEEPNGACTHQKRRMYWTAC